MFDFLDYPLCFFTGFHKWQVNGRKYTDSDDFPGVAPVCAHCNRLGPTQVGKLTWKLEADEYRAQVAERNAEILRGKVKSNDDD